MIIKVKKRKVIDVPGEDVCDEMEFLNGYVQAGSARSKGTENDFRVSNIVTNDSNKMYIRIGTNILKNMGWKIGERLGIFYKDESFVDWIICKASRGYILGREGTQNHGRFCLKVDGLKPLKTISPKYECKKDHIEFKLENQ